jgi:hypothetical protein
LSRLSALEIATKKLGESQASFEVMGKLSEDALQLFKGPNVQKVWGRRRLRELEQLITINEKKPTLSTSFYTSSLPPKPHRRRENSTAAELERMAQHFNFLGILIEQASIDQEHDTIQRIELAGESAPSKLSEMIARRTRCL